MKRFNVVVTRKAERDLDEIVSYIADHDSVDRALSVGARIEEAVAAKHRYDPQLRFRNALWDRYLA